MHDENPSINATKKAATIEEFIVDSLVKKISRNSQKSQGDKL